MRSTLVALLFTLGLSACGGVAEEAEPSSVDPFMNPGLSEDAAPAAETGSNDVSAMGPIGGGCGRFQERCCTGAVCYDGLECDPTSGKCLH